MTLLIRSELRKLATRPLTLVLAAVFVVAVFDITWTAQGFGHSQWHAAVNSYQFAQRFGECGSPTSATFARCKATVAPYDMAAARDLLSYGRDIASAAAPGQRPSGSLGWAAGLFASVPGLAAAFLLAASSVAGEWEQRTATTLFLAERRLDRVLLAKATAIWLLLMALLVLCALLTAGYDLLYSQHAYPLGQFAPQRASLIAYSVRRGAAAALMVAAAAALGTLAAARWRNRASVLALGIALSLSAFLGPPWPRLWAWTPSGFLASLTRFRTEKGIWDHAWPQSPDSGVPLALRAVSAAVLLAVVVAALRSGHRKRGLL